MENETPPLQRAYNDIGINRFPMGDALHQVGTKVQAV